MWNQKPSFRFEIDNFSAKESGIASHKFVSGGCEWYLNVWPKGHHLVGDHLSVFLYVANQKSLGTGWKRTASYYYVALSQSDKVLYISNVEQYKVFRAESPGWGFQKTLPFPKFQEKGFLENDKLIIEVYVNVVEAVDGEGGDVLEKKETVDINGFHVFASQVTSARKIFAEHPDFVQDFKPKNQVVKTEYMNVLLGLINTLHKPPLSLSETELNNAHSELTELTEAGFKLDWLKEKLEEVYLERKKSNDFDGSRVQQLEERVKNLELMDLVSMKSKLEEVSLERKAADDADGSRFQQLEERVKILELMDLGSMKSKLEEVSLERKKADYANGSRVQQLEERFKNLELIETGFKLDCLKSMLEDVSLDMKIADDGYGTRFQQLEDSVKNLEMMVSYLRVELDKEKAKSCADGFLLVNEVV